VVTVVTVVPRGLCHQWQPRKDFLLVVGLPFQEKASNKH